MYRITHREISKQAASELIYSWQQRFHPFLDFKFSKPKELSGFITNMSPHTLHRARPMGDASITFLDYMEILKILHNADPILSLLFMLKILQNLPIALRIKTEILNSLQPAGLARTHFLSLVSHKTPTLLFVINRLLPGPCRHLPPSHWLQKYTL